MLIHGFASIWLNRATQNKLSVCAIYRISERYVLNFHPASDLNQFSCSRFWFVFVAWNELLQSIFSNVGSLLPSIFASEGVIMVHLRFVDSTLYTRLPDRCYPFLDTSVIGSSPMIFGLLLYNVGHCCLLHSAHCLFHHRWCLVSFLSARGRHWADPPARSLRIEYRRLFVYWLLLLQEKFVWIVLSLKTWYNSNAVFFLCLTYIKCLYLCR